jgi:DNA primase
MYDVKQNRVVFLIKDSSEKIIDAIGRSLDKDSKVKWFRYGKSKTPFIVDGEVDKNVVVIVEDCASACAVSCGFSGLALLGTSLTNSTLSVIRNKWSRAIICLDKDATDKALKMSDRLNFYLQTDMKMLERDLKYEKKNNIYRIFELSKVCSTEYENAGDL